MQWMQLLGGTVSSPHAPGRQERLMSLHAWLGSILWSMAWSLVIPAQATGINNYHLHVHVLLGRC